MQLKACFKKELLAFWRTKRVIILSSVFIGLALFLPLFTQGMNAIVESMAEFYSEEFMEMSNSVFSNASNGLVTAISSFSEIALLMFLLLLNPFAGGEQKKRSVIIPRSSGLRSFSYIFPKYIVYPAAVFVLSFLSVLTASGISAVIFEVNDLEMSRVMLAAVLLGVYLMMYVCFHLSLGTATGKAGMSAAICVTVSMILPILFQAIQVAEQMSSGTIEGMGTYAYNPFALALMASSVMYGDIPVREVVMTVLFALVIMAIVYFIALFAQNAKKIDNTGNDILL
jgi:hypothetical protein